MERPPRQGIQCQLGKGTAMVGMPRAFRDLTRGANSSAPVRNPGTMMAALIFGRVVDDDGGDGWGWDRE